jgi:hypothetical protein
MGIVDDRRASTSAALGSWGFNLDGSDEAAWRPPRVEVFEVAPDRWAYGFAVSEQEVNVRGGLHRERREAIAAALKDALDYFGPAHQRAIREELVRQGLGEAVVARGPFRRTPAGR